MCFPDRVTVPGLGDRVRVQAAPRNGRLSDTSSPPKIEGERLSGSHEVGIPSVTILVAVVQIRPEIIRRKVQSSSILPESPPRPKIDTWVTKDG